MSQFLSDQENAVQTAISSDRLASLSDGQYQRLRAYLLSDSYAFTKVVCGHADLVPEFHMPLSYVICGLADKLVPLLNDQSFDSYATREIRKQLWKRGVDWNTPGGFRRLSELLDFVNVRVYRGSFKSSIGTHGGGLFIATRDPNETIWIVSNSDENAWAFCSQIGDTILKNPTYAALFPDRIPSGNPKELVTQGHITLGGRSISHPQTTIEADGYQTKRISAHFSTFIVDDLVARENSSPVMLKGVRQWLAGLPGFEMATRRVRRIHIGTIYDEEDDNKFLTSDKLATECLTINIPIEVFENGYVENMLVRGKPTNPRLHSVAKIQKLQDKILADPEEGPISWRCNYLLDATAAGGRLFSSTLVNDPERSYVKVTHPKIADRFLVARPIRNEQGNKLTKDDWKGADDDPKRFRWLALDPWRELDRVVVVDPSWAEGGDNWAVTCTGQDFEDVRFQLETQSGTTGLDGWVAAVVDMVEFWRPRIVGFDGNAYQDAVVQNMLKTDKRLRKIRGLFVPVKSHGRNKYSRIRSFVAEPMKMFRLLRDPDDSVTASEMTGYKGDAKATDGILDTLAMSAAVHVARSSREQKDARAARLVERNRTLRQQIDPVTGAMLAT